MMSGMMSFVALSLPAPLSLLIDMLYIARMFMRSASVLFDSFACSDRCVSLGCKLF
jgi:hypothetical protein